MFKRKPQDTATEAVDLLVWNYAAGDVIQITPLVVTSDKIVGAVTTRKQYGQGQYTYHVDRIKKTVKMRGHVCKYQFDDCVSTGGSENRA